MPEALPRGMDRDKDKVRGCNEFFDDCMNVCTMGGFVSM